MDIIISFFGQFSLIIVSFLIAIISAISKTTLENKKCPKNITLSGWILVSLSIAVLFLSCNTFISKTKSDKSLELSSLLEIEKAIDNSLEPFYLVTDDLYPENRFMLVHDFEPFETFENLCDVDIHEMVSTNAPFFSHRNSLQATWGEYLSNTSKVLRNRLYQISSSFGNYLDYELLLAVSEVASHPFLDLLEFSHFREQRHNISNRFPNNTTLCMDGQIRERYLIFQNNYLTKLSHLEKLIREKNAKISKLLKYNTCAPIFLRQAGGILSTKCIKEETKK